MRALANEVYKKKRYENTKKIIDNKIILHPVIRISTRAAAQKTYRPETDLFGVELHLVLSLWEQLNVIRSVDLLGDYSNFISNRELERNYKLE